MENKPVSRYSRPVTKRYTRNPYLNEPLQRHYLAYNVRSAHTLALVSSLSAQASRLLFVMPYFYDAATTEVRFTHQQLKPFISWARSQTIGRAITEMVDKDLVQKGSKYGIYYLSTDVWLPIALVLHPA